MCDDVVMIETVFSNQQFVGLYQSDVSCVFFNAELDGPAALSDVNLAAFKGDLIYVGCS